MLVGFIMFFCLNQLNIFEPCEVAKPAKQPRFIFSANHQTIKIMASLALTWVFRCNIYACYVATPWSNWDHIFTVFCSIFRICPWGFRFPASKPFHTRARPHTMRTADSCKWRILFSTSDSKKWQLYSYHKNSSEVSNSSKKSGKFRQHVRLYYDFLFLLRPLQGPPGDEAAVWMAHSTGDLSNWEGKWWQVMEPCFGHILSRWCWVLIAGFLSLSFAPSLGYEANSGPNV